MTRNYDGFWINQEADLENSEGPREVALLEILLDQPHHVRGLDLDGHDWSCDSALEQVRGQTRV